jgi:hypothetical protein
MISATVDTRRLNQAVSEFIGATGKAVREEMARQGKFLAYELASAAPPASRGQSNGLSPGNRATSQRKIKRQLEFYLRGEGEESGMRGLASVLALNNPGDLASYYGTGAWNVDKMGETVRRIMRSVPANPELALKNLRQYLVYQVNAALAQAAELKTDYREQYYKQIGSRANRGPSKVIRVQGPQGGEGNARRVRSTIQAKAFRSIGSIKAGWIQAGDKLPAKSAVSTPSWLSGKPQAGRSSIEISPGKVLITVANTNGNPGGIEDRTGYVQRAVDRRADKVLYAMEGAIRYLSQKGFKK